MTSESFDGAAEARISNASADPICEFYTNHPFPPPLENLERAVDLFKDENVRRSEFHLLWPDREYRADIDVLIAGCGTWQGAKHSITHPDARVVAIDVSTTSLQHTEKLKDKYNLTNLEVRQLPIENAADLDQRFDHIICTGVLHHLVDPDAGLRALRNVLKPDGKMYLMVYAPYGRAGVYMMQEYCRLLNVGTSIQEVDELIAALKMVPQFHPVLAAQGGSRDFLNSDALVDAMLNPRDRAYSVPQIFDLLDRHDLALARWQWQAAYLPECGSVTRTPHANRLAALPEREQYAAIELWRGLMSNHSFVAQPNDADSYGSKVRFDDESYLRYVPIRLPFTICVQQQIPPGAAGVLVNQTHVFSDLFVIVNEQEKRLVDAIDGRRTVSEIAESVKDDGEAPDAREFFQKLWRHDQVVFDTSQSR